MADVRDYIASPPRWNEDYIRFLYDATEQDVDYDYPHLNKRLITMAIVMAIVLCAVLVGIVGLVFPSFVKDEQKVDTDLISKSMIPQSIGASVQHMQQVAVKAKPKSIKKPAPQPAKVMKKRPAPKAVAKHPSQPKVTTVSQVKKVASVNQNDLLWLSRLIHAEAGNQSFTGKIAVANVVLNRVHSGQFPSSVYGVIFQKGQFQTVSNGKIYNQPTSEDYRAAREALAGHNVVGNALFFENASIAESHWIRTHRKLVAKIGDHSFYR